MKPVIIIAIVDVIVVIVLGLIMSPSEKTMSEFDVKPWLGLDCDEMLDFSGTEKHNMMYDSMHIEFHEHYMDNCSDIEPELALQECAGTARCITGSVTKIIDGDTIHVNGESIRFSLSSAPELSGFGGVESRDFIDTICPVGSDVIVDEDDGQTGESYGRIIGVIYCNGMNLNSELLDADLGYLEERFCDSSEFANDSWAQKHGC